MNLFGQLAAIFEEPVVVLEENLVNNTIDEVLTSIIEDLAARYSSVTTTPTLDIYSLPYHDVTTLPDLQALGITLMPAS